MAEKPTVLVTRKLPDPVEQRLQRDYRPLLNAEDRCYSPDQLIACAANAEAIVACPSDDLSAVVIARLPPSVRAIANFSVGYDHCDLSAAAARGIIVTNTPDVLTDATAEIAILCMLGAARRASEGDRLVRGAAWTGWSPTFMLGRQITGKRLGVLGMGRVGQATARRARGFDMTIHYHNRSRLDSAAEAGAHYHATIEDLLPHCDVLSIHCPATPETTGLLDQQRLALLPPGAIVVNTGRGPIIDDDALIAALKSGQVYAAGLDVFTGEPDRIHPQYRTLDNVFLLPHLGSATEETRAAMGFRALDNLDAFFAGQPPRDRLV